MLFTKCLDCTDVILVNQERCDWCKLLKECKENPLHLDYWGNRPKGRNLKIDPEVYFPHPRQMRGCLGKYQKCKHDWPPEHFKVDGNLVTFRCAWCHKELVYEKR